MHVIAAKAVCFKEALEPEFKEYQMQVVKNAKALCEGLKKRGVKIVSGDTDNHLMLVDLTGNDVSGKELEKRLDDAHITCNNNTERSSFSVRDKRSKTRNSGSYNSGNERGRYG